MAKKAFSIKIWAVAVLVLLLLLVLFYLPMVLKKPTSEVSAITREGVVTKIQQLNRLNSVAFSVDTVITAQKEGNWYRLWQDKQKGLFVARGRVLAGIDLAKITPEMVQVSYLPSDEQSQTPKTQITISLPSSEIFEVFLDEIQVYDWKTGLFGIIDNDPEILKQAQIQGKHEVLKKACMGNIMQLAMDNASEQVAGLFMLSGAEVVVQHQETASCL